MLPAINEKREMDHSTADEVIAGHDDPLSEAAGYLQSREAAMFYPALNRLLRKYLVQKLGIAAEELNKKTIIEKLDITGIRNDISLQLLELMDEIEMQLYTPSSDNDKMQERYDRAGALIQVLNKYTS